MTTSTLYMTGLIGILASCATNPAPPAPDGLVVTDSTRDHTSGTFVKDGTTIDFDLSVTDGVHSAVLTSHDGQPLIETTLADGLETTTYLGRLTITGAQGDSAPTVTGDSAAFEEFTAMPEAGLLRPFRDQLASAGIDREMYAAAKPARNTGEHWNATVLQCGQHVAIPTYSWWWSVELILINENTRYLASYHLTDGALNYNNTLSWYSDRFGPFSWWTVYVTNNCWYGPSPIYVDSTLL